MNDTEAIQCPGCRAWHYEALAYVESQVDESGIGRDVYRCSDCGQEWEVAWTEMD